MIRQKEKEARIEITIVIKYCTFEMLLYTCKVLYSEHAWSLFLIPKACRIQFLVLTIAVACHRQNAFYMTSFFSLMRNEDKDPLHTNAVKANNEINAQNAI